MENPHDQEKQAKELARKYDKIVKLAKNDPKLAWCIEGLVETAGGYVQAVIRDEAGRRARMVQQREEGITRDEFGSKKARVDPLDEARRAAHESLLVSVKALERCLQRDYDISMFGLRPEEYSESNRGLHSDRRNEMATKAHLLWKGLNGDY